ncbi:MAG: ABC transporter substrate-binding protein [Treponema sp.]|nr:ABC transporter substrate-binding protein [Treponema sp.]
MKKGIILLFCLIIAGSLFAGGRSQQQDGGERGSTIYIYSNSNQDTMDRLAAMAAEDGFNLVAVFAGGGAITDRIIAERHNPVANIVYGLNVFLRASLIENDALTPYVPVWAGQVQPGLNHRDGYYHAFNTTSILLTYDAGQMPPAQAPRDWPDLWRDPRFHGRYQYETALTGGTTRMVIAGILGRHLDPRGYLGVSEQGWNEIRAFYAHGVPNTGAADLFAQMVNTNNDVVMGQLHCNGILSREIQYGVTAGYALPAVGVPQVIEAVALANNNTNIREAQRFLDWFNPEKQYALRLFDPDPRFEGLPVQDIDWTVVSARIDEWCEHIYLNIMP